MTAQQIIELLAAKHADDVFVPECKDGSTWGGHFRMDAWAMAKSWANPLVSAYEVKVTRGDWLKDQKVHQYLDYCNCLWLVSPKDIIRLDEVPAECGLLWVASTGRQLVTKKKAPYRQATVPESVYRYILMSRCRITANWHDHGEDPKAARLAYWRSVLEDRKQGRDLGYLIKGRIKDEMMKLREENAELRRSMDTLKAFRDELRAAGVDPDTLSSYAWARRRALDNAMGDHGRTLLETLRALGGSVERAIEALGQATAAPARAAEVGQ